MSQIIFIYVSLGLGISCWLLALAIALIALVLRQKGLILAGIFLIWGSMLLLPAFIEPIRDCQKEIILPISVTKTNYTTVIVYQINDHIWVAKRTDAACWASTNIVIEQTIGKPLFGQKLKTSLQQIKCYPNKN